jgi:hypothetical protein
VAEATEAVTAEAAVEVVEKAIEAVAVVTARTENSMPMVNAEDTTTPGEKESLLLEVALD